MTRDDKEIRQEIREAGVTPCEQQVVQRLFDKGLNEPLPQSAPDTGKWWAATDEHGNHDIHDQNSRHVARARTVQDAARIVHDHNAIPQLVAALDAAMKVVSDRAAGGRMLTTTEQADQIWQQCDEAIRAARGGER